jgi:plastocyanin
MTRPTTGPANPERGGLSSLAAAHPIRALATTALVAIAAIVGIASLVRSSRPSSGNSDKSHGGAAGAGRWTGAAPTASGTRVAAAVDLGSIWGRAFQGRAPAYETLAAVKSQADAPPVGASVSHTANTITFAGSTVAVTIVANPPNGRDMAFRIGGLENPVLVVRQGAHVTVRFINGDSDSAHGWLLLDPLVKVGNSVHGPRAFSGSYAPILGDPTGAGQPLETITFTATTPGTYIYECPVPGHAAMGMRGSFVVNA